MLNLEKKKTRQTKMEQAERILVTSLVIKTIFHFYSPTKSRVL